MALIKSALELAMEKSAGLSVDKAELKKKELITQGRLTAGKYLGEDGLDLAAEQKLKEKELKDEELQAWKEGISEAFLSRINLVYEAPIPAEIIKAAEGLAVLGGRRAADLASKGLQALESFAGEFKQLKEAIVQQMGPALKQRAAQVAAQTGASTKYVMEKDPAYLKILSENLEPMRAEYQKMVDQLKEELRKTI